MDRHYFYAMMRGKGRTDYEIYLNTGALLSCQSDFDELIQMFRYRHLQPIQRSIGMGSKSLRGRPVQFLEEGLAHRFFPALWEIRYKMTDQWASKHGEVRDPLRE